MYLESTHIRETCTMIKCLIYSFSLVYIVQGLIDYGGLVQPDYLYKLYRNAGAPQIPASWNHK